MRRAISILCNGSNGISVPQCFQPSRSFKYSAVLRECRGGTARVRYVKAMEPTNESYISKNTRIGRPFVKGIWVYKKQLTSLLSITNRLTAVYLSMQLAAFGLGCVWACRNKRNFDDFMRWLESKELRERGIFIMKALLVYPIVYHTVLGMRHLLWDTGRFLTIPGVYTTGYAALFLIFVLTAGMLCCGRRPPPKKDLKTPKH